MSTHADRNLLFGILALQLDFINRDQLIAAMNAWVLAKEKPLGQLLREQTALDGPSHELLDALVQKHLALHENDPQKSLAALSSLSSVQGELEKLDDPDLQASLAHGGPVSNRPESPGNHPLPSARNLSGPVENRPHDPPHDDPDSTLTHTAGTSTSKGTRFRILRPHAKGGLGQVHVALDEELRRQVALKEIQEKYADHPESRARFLLEAEVTGGLEHPGIVPVYGLGTYADGRPFYAMRFIRGDSLKEAIARFHSAPFSPASQKRGGDALHGERLVEFRKLLGRFTDVCQAIAYAHSRGVLHRDLKPGNIMLGQYGETLVVDWGLAKTLDAKTLEAQPNQLESASSRTDEPLLRPTSSGSAETIAGTALGTPAYMSPEQAEGRLDLLGPASDVYSLGATLYHLLTGQPPFTGKDVVPLLADVRRGRFPPPRQVNPSAPPGLEAICLKAMALHPQDRYASPKDLADDVEHWLADEPVSAWPEPWTVKARRWMGRHRVAVTSAAAVLVVGVAALVAGNVLLSRANADLAEANRRITRSEKQVREQLRVVEALLYNSRVREAAAYLRDGDFLALRSALDETKAGRRGPEYGYLARRHAMTLRPLAANTRAFTSLALSPDGKRLYSGSDDQTIRAWDPGTGEEVLTLRGHTERVTSLALSPDGKFLYSGSGTFGKPGEIKAWDLGAGEEIMTLRGHLSSVESLALSPDGKRLYSGSDDRTIKVWDPGTGKEVLTLRGHTERVTSLALSPDGKSLYSGSNDHTIKAWDLGAGAEAATLRGHAEGVGSLALSPDGKSLYSGSIDRTIKVWDLGAGKEATTLRGHSNFVLSLALSADGKRLCSGSYDQTIKVWDLEGGAEAATVRGHSDFVLCLALSPDGKRLWSGSWDRTIKAWDLDAGKQAASLGRHAGNVEALVLSPEGRRLCSAGGGDRAVRVWDPGTGEEVMALHGHSRGVRSLALSPDGKRLCSGSSFLENSIKVWDMGTGKEVLTLRGHKAPVLCLAISSDGQRLYSGSLDNTIKVWDLGAGSEVRTLSGHTGPVLSLALSPDDKRLCSGSWDDTIKVWDPGTGSEVRTLPGHTGGVGSLALSPDGLRLYSGGGLPENTIKVWDLEAGDEVLTLRGHSERVLCLVVAFGGKRLISGSFDQTLKVWDLEAGKEALTLRGHAGAVLCLALSSDGKRLFSGCQDKTIKVWDLEAPPEGEAAKGK